MTRAYAGLVLFDVVLAVAGFGVLVALGFVRGRRDVLRHLGLALLVGWASMGVLLSLAVMLGADPGVVQVLVVATALVLACLRVRRRVPALEPERVFAPARPGPLGRVVAVAGAALLGLTLAVALAEAARASSDMAWDTWVFWLPKAKALFYFHGLDTGLSGYTTQSHVEYPPLVPVMDAASFHFMGGVYTMLLPLQRCLLAAAFVGSALVLVSRHAPGWIAFPLLAMLMLAPHVWSGMFAVMPDQVLGYLLAIAAAACVLWLDERRAVWLALGVVLLSAAALTKLEGVLFGGLLAVAVALASCALRGRGGLPALALLLGPLAILPWRIWLAAHGLPGSSPDYSLRNLLDPGYLGDHSGNLRVATHYLLDVVFDSGRWTPALPLTLAVLILLAPVLRSLSGVVLAWFVVSFAALATVYWIGNPELDWYLRTSADRVVGLLPLVAGTLLPLLLGIALARETSRAEPLPRRPSCCQDAPGRAGARPQGAGRSRRVSTGPPG